jgi:hypothetical protein
VDKKSAYAMKFFSFTLVAKQIMMMLLLLSRGGKKKFEKEKFSVRSEFSF